MAVSITHTFQSAIADGGDATLVRPTNWNAGHTFTMGTQRMLGRLTAGTGAIEELTPEQVRTFAAAVPAARTVTAGTGLTGGGSLAANRTFALTGLGLAFHNMAADGFAVRTGASAVTARSIAGTSGVAVTNGDGVAGNPSVALTGQALALHNLATSGMVARTGSGTVAARTITAGAGIAVTNGDGVSGNPTVAVATTAGAIGTYVLAAAPAAPYAFGDTLAGSSLQPSSSNGVALGSALTGTWRCMGASDTGAGVTLWQRIS